MPKLKKTWNEKDLKPIIRDWIKRMRSNRYKQTTTQLRGGAFEGKGVGNCCLGLLCDAIAAKGYGRWKGRVFTESLEKGRWRSELSAEWQERLRMAYPTAEKSPFGGFRQVSIHQIGIEMNDLDGEVPVAEDALFPGEVNDDFLPLVEGAPIPVPFPLIADEAERFYTSIGVL